MHAHYTKWENKDKQKKIKIFKDGEYNLFRLSYMCVLYFKIFLLIKMELSYTQFCSGL